MLHAADYSNMQLAQMISKLKDSKKKDENLGLGLE